MALLFRLIKISVGVTLLLITISLTSTTCLRRIFGRGIEEDITAEKEADNNTKVQVLPEGDPEEDGTLIEDSYVGEALMQVQELPREERRKRNKNLILSLRTLKGSLTEAFIWMKNHLHPSTCKTILEDHDHTPSCRTRMQDGLEDTIEKAKDEYDKLSCSCSCKNYCHGHTSSICLSCPPRLEVTCCKPGPKESGGLDVAFLIKRIKSVISLYIDLLKDSIILATILKVIGSDFF